MAQPAAWESDIKRSIAISPRNPRIVRASISPLAGAIPGGMAAFGREFLAVSSRMRSKSRLASTRYLTVHFTRRQAPPGNLQPGTRGALDRCRYGDYLGPVCTRGACKVRSTCYLRKLVLCLRCRHQRFSRRLILSQHSSFWFPLFDMTQGGP